MFHWSSYNSFSYF
jgi:chromosome segregation ATPase